MPGSRPNPGEMSMTPETAVPLLSTSTPLTLIGAATVGKLFQTTMKRPLVAEYATAGPLSSQAEWPPETTCSGPITPEHLTVRA